MQSKKIYLQPSKIVLMGMSDLMDTQNGRQIVFDLEARKLHFIITMLDTEWTLRFSVAPIDMTRCVVTLEIESDDADRDSDAPAETKDDLAGYVMRREFAMLDAMLLIGTPLEPAREGMV